MGAESTEKNPWLIWLWLLPVVAFGYLSFVSPWPVAERALREFGQGPRVVVGMSYQSGASHTMRRQMYLVFPDALRTLRAHEVIEDNGAVRVEPFAYGFPLFGGLYGLWIAASLWYWRRRAAK